MDVLFERLAASSFRRRFRLGSPELRYVEEKGLPLIVEHGRSFIEQRLAPARPANDGKQTPYKGHPVFIAQHATATCCRGCLEKWHGIRQGHALTEQEIEHVIAVIARWTEAECRSGSNPDPL